MRIQIERPLALMRSACAWPRIILGGKLPTPRAALFATCLFALLCVGWMWIGAAFSQTGWDFPQFYIAAHVPAHALYDRAAFQDFVRTHLAPAGVAYIPPYVRPAVFSLPLRLMMWPPYRTAFLLWAAIQVAFLIASLALLWGRFPRIPALFVGALGFFFPAMFGVITGQDANAQLLLLTLGLALLCAGNGWAAGAVLGLAVYKFNLVLLVPVFLLVRRQYTALAWFMGTAAALGAASTLLAPPASYVQMLTQIQRYTTGFGPERMLGLRSLAYALGAPNLFWIVAASAVLLAIWAMRVLPLAESFSVAVLTSLLCAWHVNWYDGALLVIPMMVAFRPQAAVWRKVVTCALLATPIWIFLPRVSTLLVLALWLAFLAAARERAIKTGEPTPAIGAGN